jgi:hypothetical protein
MHLLVYDFDVYMGKTNVQADVLALLRRDGNLAQGVVLKLMDGLENEGWTIATDNHFTSIDLFQKLHVKGIYAMSIVRSNKIGFPEILADVTTLNKLLQGSLDWRMHNSRTIASVAWKNKNLVYLLSCYANLVVLEGEGTPTISHGNGGIRESIPTSLLHLEYTTYMRGVDVANQLRSNYSC